MNLIICKWNNYYNRTVKSITLETAMSSSVNIYTLYNTNFNPGDEIITTHVFGSNAIPYNGTGDYLVAVENNEIISKWFILECARIRGGQWQLTLRRDLISDFFANVITSPCFIEKATLSANDPFIFNNENMTFNQIKTSETFLMDRTKCPWIVGYYDRTLEQPINITRETFEEEIYDMAVSSSFADWQYHYTKSNPLNVYDRINYYFIWNDTNGTKQLWEVSKEGWASLIKESKNNSDITNALKELLPGVNVNNLNISSINTNVISKITAGDMQMMINNIDDDALFNAVGSLIDIGNSTEYYKLKQYDNKRVKFVSSDGTSQILKITIKRDLDKKYQYRQVPGGSLYTILNNGQKATKVDSNNQRVSAYYTPSAGNNDYYYYTFVSSPVYVEVVEAEAEPLSVSFDGQRYELSDAPYGMFTMPCPNPGEVFEIYTEKTLSVKTTMTRETALNVANLLSTKYSGSGAIYDIQLLPYCPVPELLDIRSDGKFYYGDDIRRYASITTPDKTNPSILYPRGFVFFPTSSSFTITIPLDNPIKIDNPKIESQTDMYRLVSPNFNGQFEFNAAKNNGITSFNVDCTYKPYSPYIHINPDFKGLYGNDFDDARGLICGGDFSLTQMTDAWRTYQLQNKNYQASFDRQIESLELNNRIQTEREIWQASAGALTGAASGALTGSSIGGAVGAGIGAAVGGVVSGLAGARDVELNKLLRADAIDLTRDQFGYQLGNIRALPNSISKTTAYTLNNKIFPILEYYTCTPEEKTALANKIAYNGMTVMRIGRIADVMSNTWSYNNISAKNYIKAQLIRLEGTDMDTHMINEISNELYKGVYI